MAVTNRELCLNVLKRINGKLGVDVRLGSSNGELYVYTNVDGCQFHAPFEFNIIHRKPLMMLEFLCGVEAGIDLMK